MLCARTVGSIHGFEGSNEGSRRLRVDLRNGTITYSAYCSSLMGAVSSGTRGIRELDILYPLGCQETESADKNELARVVTKILTPNRNSLTVFQFLRSWLIYDLIFLVSLNASNQVCNFLRLYDFMCNRQNHVPEKVIFYYNLSAPREAVCFREPQFVGYFDSVYLPIRIQFQN